MGLDDKQMRDLDAALDSVSEQRVADALSGTIQDALAFCRASLVQVDRRHGAGVPRTPEAHGQNTIDLLMLLGVAKDTVAHAEMVELVLKRIGEPADLPPERDVRDRLREARNLLAVHREQRVLYWRLTDRHTERVARGYHKLGVEVPSGTIDTEMFGGTDHGLVGGILSLPGLVDALQDLKVELEALAKKHSFSPGPPDDDY